LSATAFSKLFNTDAYKDQAVEAFVFLNDETLRAPYAMKEVEKMVFWLNCEAHCCITVSRPKPLTNYVFNS